MATTRSILKEGTIAGLLGAAGVAAWFLAVDVIAGHPFATPELLGRSLFSVLGKGIALSAAGNVFGYTLVHVAAFIVIGLVVSAIVAASERTPGVLVGLVLLFAVFEVGFYGFTLFLSEASELGQLAWYQVGAANLVAAFLMGRYLWRAHPELADRVEGALSARF